MGWEDPDFISALDLGVAYRKAKADLYYERDHPISFALCEYEAELDSNLARLFQKLQSADLDWMTAPGFVGDWSVIPKGIEDKPNADESVAWRPSDPDECWRARVEARRNKPVATFRVVGAHSIEFHITSTLWMMKVGHLYDAILGPWAYGSRLRRYRPRGDGKPGEVNSNAHGSFQPYFRPFGQWRDNGLTVMRRAVEEGKRVVAITADVRKFYHCTSPNFLLEPGYLAAVGMRMLTADQERFTRAFVEAVHGWAGRTPIHSSDASVGLPVGLPAARLVANVALAELDQLITRGLTPLYYGRYVDDILLVLEDTQRFKDGVEVWKYIRRRVGSALRVRKSRRKLEVQFVRPYLGNSQIILAGEKQKVFLLEGPGGLALVGSIERQVRARASEWRALPDLPDTPVGLSADVVSACGDDGEEVDNLRKAEAMSTRRAALAIRLRNIEAFDHDLLPDQWKAQRAAFLQVARRHLLALPQLFNFAPYVRRLFALAIACRDYREAAELVERLSKQIEHLATDCTIELTAPRKDVSDVVGVLDRWRDHMGRALSEGLASALGHPHLSDVTELDETLSRLGAFVRGWRSPLSNATTAFRWSQRFFVHDLARVPYRFRYFPGVRAWHGDETSPHQIVVASQSPFRDGELFARVLAFFRAVSGTSDDTKLPIALFYPTRPFTVPELYFLVPSLLTAGDKRKIEDWTLAFRGFRPANTLPGADKDGGPITIPREPVRGPVHVAVTSWSTTEESWKAAVTSVADPDPTRYARLNRMLNDVLRAPVRVDYVVLPELAVPSRWFFRFSNKLATRGISLIAGVEYLHHGVSSVSNQVWCSLVSSFLGFPSLVVYRRDKERPALDEERMLWNAAGKRLVPLRVPSKPILCHGGFNFGVLICSELTNLEHRARYRGRVDALFVPEWNKDTETFSALVEASALDIHAYIIQCNDRVFGDSRIRSPAKDSWKRDIVRIKGGIEDYFVIGAVDVSALRRFQSAHRSPGEPFKPVPDGFEIDPSRRQLP